jgi:hypothetical protein
MDRHLKSEMMREVKRLDKATGKIVSVWEERPRHVWTGEQFNPSPSSFSSSLTPYVLPLSPPF